MAGSQLALYAGKEALDASGLISRTKTGAGSVAWASAPVPFIISSDR
jgi:hypothetical protein